MSDLYDQIASQRGSLERLVSRIPGFTGYQERGDRRTADRMLRDHIADQLGQQVGRMSRIEKTILDKMGLSYMSETRDAKTKLQTYHDRVKAAAPGYSGLFSAMKIGAEELTRIYSFDEAQVRYVVKISEALDTLDQAADNKEGIDAAIDGVYQAAVKANEAFALREDVLTNLNKSL